MFPLPRVPFGLPIFDPRPNGVGLFCDPKAIPNMGVLEKAQGKHRPGLELIHDLLGQAALGCLACRNAGPTQVGRPVG